MLCLDRKLDEDIVIDYGGVEVVVKVLRVGQTTVKLGIAAPEAVVVRRGEVEDRRR